MRSATNTFQGSSPGQEAVCVLPPTGAKRLSDEITGAAVTLTPEASAIEALRAINNGRFGHLGLIGNGRTLGAVSRNNFTGGWLKSMAWKKNTQMTLSSNASLVGD